MTDSRSCVAHPKQTFTGRIYGTIQEHECVTGEGKNPQETKLHSRVNTLSSHTTTSFSNSYRVTSMMNDAMLLILPGRRKKINQTPDHQSVILEWAAQKTLPSSGLTKSTQSSYATPQTIWHASTDPNKQKYLKRINSPISPLHARTLAPPLYTAVRSHIQQLGTSPLGWKMRRIKWQHLKRSKDHVTYIETCGSLFKCSLLK